MQEEINETPFHQVAGILKQGRRFLLTTHKDPDTDGIGSMLALGKTLVDVGKEVVFFTEKPVSGSLKRLKGAREIVQRFDAVKSFDAVVILDCAEMARLGDAREYLMGRNPLINIDHHKSNGRFGDFNLIDSESSSTAELVFGLIKEMGFPISQNVAENIFAAIQADTGSFTYDNTTAACLRIAAEMMDFGTEPWDVFRKIMGGYDLPRLNLLKMALGTIEFHYAGRLCIMTLTREMFQRSGAIEADSEKFVDYPRFVHGVEIAVLIREDREEGYRFSLRSNGGANVSRLASRFGGGGHERAAGFDYHGAIEPVKELLLKEASVFLDGTDN